MDILRYPSCKLYENGSFRLPVSLKRSMESKRYQKLVAVAAPHHVCILMPVSIWEKTKSNIEDCMGITYPKYPQSISKTHLYLHKSLIEYLDYPKKLYFELNEDNCIIYNERRYIEKNIKEKEKLETLYEML